MTETNLIYVQIGNQIVDGPGPADRTFRNAWALGADKVITIDMVKALEIKKNSLRQERKPLLDQLDVEYQRADEAGDAAEKKAVALRKKALRDVTANVKLAAATTPDALAALTLDGLLK
jgi:hypothetical protein